MPLENFENSYFCFRLAQFLTSFSYINNLLLLCAVFHNVTSSIDHVLCINLSPEVLVFGSFNVHVNDLVKSVIISKDLTQIAYFQAKIADCDSHSTAYLDLFISSNPTTSSVVASSLLCEILIIFFCLSFHWLSFNLKSGCFFSSHSFWLFSHSLQCSLWSSKTCSVGRYLTIGCYYYCRVRQIAYTTYKCIPKNVLCTRKFLEVVQSFVRQYHTFTLLWLCFVHWFQMILFFLFISIFWSECLDV